MYLREMYLHVKMYLRKLIFYFQDRIATTKTAGLRSLIRVILVIINST